MQAAPSHEPAHPFFLDAEPGRRFCLYHPPRGQPRGAVLHVPAHGEEMNKARRMVARQSRLLAEYGIGVLQLDLYGCGDSEGLSGDARWEIWRRDVALGLAWLRKRTEGPLTLWGLRLGSLLALDVAREQQELSSVLLWQPVIDGGAYLTQFLRMRLAADMLASGRSLEGGVEALRRMLAGGASLDIAGYTLAPALAAVMDGLAMDRLAAPDCPVHWYELVANAERPLAPARAAVAARCSNAGWLLSTQKISGPPFWSTQEISEAPLLLEASLMPFLRDEC